MNDVPADSVPARPTRWQDAAETTGCFLPFVTPPVALGLGWWLGGVWVGLASLVVAGVFGLWLIYRVFGRGQMLELGCVVILIMILLASLVPAIQKIQQAAERKRAERETGWQIRPNSPWTGDQQMWVR
jgi:predicted membrane-bound spermidine synthase